MRSCVHVLCRVLAGGALAMGAVASADAASFRGAPLLRAPTSARLDCLGATVDGALVWWRDRHRLIRAGTLDAATTVGPATECPTGQAAPDGLAVLALAQDQRLSFAWRPPGGRFSAFSPVALPAQVPFAEARTLAFGGPLVALGAHAEQSPALVLRSADGSVRAVLLPTVARSATAESQVMDPLPGVDGAGRGLVVYGVDGELLAARFDATGVLGAPQVLAPDGVEQYVSGTTLAVAPDGSAAVGWVSGRRTTVVTGTTEHGFDLATATTAPVDWSFALEPDGGVVAATADSTASGVRLLIVTRVPGRPFTRVHTVPVEDVTDDLSIAVRDGRYLVVSGGLYSAVDSRMEAVTGRVGETPGSALAVPNASAVVDWSVLALPPGKPATIITQNTRRTLCPGCLVAHERHEIGVYRLSALPERQPAGVRVTVPPRQRLGANRTIRATVTCPRRACAVRIVGGPVGSLGPDTGIDDSRTLRRGTTTLRTVLVKAPAGAFRALLRIVVDDVTGELRTQRKVAIEP